MTLDSLFNGDDALKKNAELQMNDAGIAFFIALRGKMELQFETLDYQTHAIQAAVDLFIGQPNQQTEFGLKAQE